jgi:hypothetical protein
MQPARGEPGRNGYHRPLEFFDIIVAAAANFAPGPFRRRDLPHPALESGRQSSSSASIAIDFLGVSRRKGNRGAIYAKSDQTMDFTELAETIA